VDAPGGNADLLARPAVRRVQQALAEAGLGTAVQPLTATARTALDAARALGVPVGAIVKTLAFGSDGRIVLALIAGDRRCDPHALAHCLGLPAAVRRATPDAVKRATGFTIGGVAPIGHPEPLAIAIDTSLGRFDRLFAAAGHPHCVFATRFDELKSLTGATASDWIGIP